MVNKFKLRVITKSSYIDFLHKSLEWLQVAKYCFELDQWDGVGLNCIHSAISGAEAVLTIKIGKISKDEHFKVVKQLLIEFPGEEHRGKIKTLNKIIEVKNLVEYTESRFYKKDAENILKLTERFIDWVEEICDVYKV